jgi:hypothetical protein
MARAAAQLPLTAYPRVTNTAELNGITINKQNREDGSTKRRGAQSVND